MFNRLLSVVIVAGMLWNSLPGSTAHRGSVSAESRDAHALASDAVEHHAPSAAHPHQGAPKHGSSHHAEQAAAPCHTHRGHGAGADLAAGSSEAGGHASCCDGGTCRCGCAMLSLAPVMVLLTLPRAMHGQPSTPPVLGAAPIHDRPLLRPPA